MVDVLLVEPVVGGRCDSVLVRAPGFAEPADVPVRIGEIAEQCTLQRRVVESFDSGQTSFKPLQTRFVVALETEKASHVVVDIRVQLIVVRRFSELCDDLDSRDHRTTVATTSDDLGPVLLQLPGGEEKIVGARLQRPGTFGCLYSRLLTGDHLGEQVVEAGKGRRRLDLVRSGG